MVVWYHLQMEKLYRSQGLHRSADFEWMTWTTLWRERRHSAYDVGRQA
jgi:hypothetical protein